MNSFVRFVSKKNGRLGPGDCFDPWYVGGNSGVNAGYVRYAAAFSERGDTYEEVVVFGFVEVVHRSARVSLLKKQK